MEKRENEITLKVTCSKKELVDSLIKQGFLLVKKFTLDDTYYIKNNIDINCLDNKEILKNAIILRSVIYDGKQTSSICYKKKDIDINGEILKQSSYYINRVDIDETKDFLDALNYKLLMRVIENDELYINNDFEILLKDVSGGQLLVEIETNEVYKDISSIKRNLEKYNLQLDKSNYFVKKAEIILEGIKHENS